MVLLLPCWCSGRYTSRQMYGCRRHDRLVFVLRTVKCWRLGGLALASLLKAEGLTKHYGSVIALDGVDFDIRKGVTGLLGPNGAGKSTRHQALPWPDQADLGIGAGDGRASLRIGRGPVASRLYA